MAHHLFFLTTYDATNTTKIRLGAEKDGGYVFVDGLQGNYDAYLSAGVSDEESFSRDFIAKYNIANSFAFDGTIADYPYEYTRNITFVKKNIGPSETPTTTPLKEYIQQFKNMFLKMDIEGGEYPWLNSLSLEDLRSFKQIVIEFHGINDNTWNCSYENKSCCLQKLATTHYLVHCHGNNWGGVQCVDGKYVPNVIELTYVRKDALDAVPEFNHTRFPTGIDYPNNPNFPELSLNFAPFVFPSIQP